MVDPRNDNREDFIINEDYPEEEVAELHREEYYGNSTEVFRKKTILPFIIGGIGLMVLVVILVINLSGRDEVADRDYIQSLETRIEQLENKLANIGVMDQTLEQVDRQERKINSLGERLKGFESTVTTQIDQIIKELGALHQKAGRAAVFSAPTAAPAENKAPAVTQKRVAAPKFHQVQSGDTLFRISRRYGLTVEQLRSYNNIAPDAAIYPGQKLKLSPNGKQ